MSTKTKTTSESTIVPPAAGTGVIGGATAVTDSAPINNGVASALNMFDILQGMKSSSKLDTAAIDYIDSLVKVFKDSGEGITALPVSTSKIEARVFVHDATKNAIVLIFDKTHQTLDMTPAALRALDVKKALEIGDHKDLRIVQTIVVTENDYALAGNMAAYISNAFKTLNGDKASNFTVDALNGFKVSIVTNIDAVRAYVRQVSPHAVPARDDIGILLCIEKKRDNAFNRFEEPEQIPFLAVTGYTRIMNPQDAATGMKFVPIPTITDIVSSIPNRSLLAMALPLAADAFICQSLWTRPYATFRTGQPNLGNLIMDPSTKKPCFTDSAETFHTFIRNYMVNPFLAIDITEGRARPICIDSMINNIDSVMATISTFLKTQIPPMQTAIMMFANYTGSYMEKGQIKDTRCVDYLDLAAKVTDHKQIDHLLLQPNQPQVKIEAVRAIYPEATRSLYVTTTIVLNAAIVSVMSNALTKSITLNYDMPANGNYNITTLLSQNAGNDFTSFANFNTGFQQQNLVYQQLGNIYTNLI